MTTTPRNTLSQSRARTIAALTRAINEHGAPNSFAPSELALAGAPSPMMQGKVATAWDRGCIVAGCMISYEGRRWVATPLPPGLTADQGRALRTLRKRNAAEFYGDSYERFSTLVSAGLAAFTLDKPETETTCHIWTCAITPAGRVALEGGK